MKKDFRAKIQNRRRYIKDIRGCGNERIF